MGKDAIEEREWTPYEEHLINEFHDAIKAIAITWEFAEDFPYAPAIETFLEAIEPLEKALETFKSYHGFKAWENSRLEAEAND